MSQENRSDPFRHVLIENRFNLAAGAGVLIEWEMEPWFVEPGPWIFNVFKSKRHEDGYIPVTGAQGLTNTAFAYDTEPDSFGIGIENYYRIQVITELGNAYWSCPKLAGNALPRRDLVVVRRKIANRKRMLAAGGQSTKGTVGFLLRYPDFGEPWSTPAEGSTDPNTGESLSSQSVVDFGTGVVGGYWDPIVTVVKLEPEKRMRKLTDKGMVTHVYRTAGALPFPRIRPNDVWVNARTDERFRVQSDIVTAESWAGVPIWMNLRLELLHTADIVYKFPVPTLDQACALLEQGACT